MKMKTEILKAEKIDLISYNIWGQNINSGCVVFDFENNTVTTAKKKYSIEIDREYTYKVRKDKIYCSGGISGLYKFINEINTPDSPFNPAVTDLFIREF
jgi:hypothetical protein